MALRAILSLLTTAAATSFHDQDQLTISLTRQGANSYLLSLPSGTFTLAHDQLTSRSEFVLR